MRTALEVTNVTFGYGKTPLFQGLNLSFAEGEFTAILGRNGAGKTTLLRILSGTLPTQERARADGVLIFGKKLSAIPPKMRARLVAVVPQERRSSLHLKVEEVLALGRLPYLGPFSRFSADDRKSLAREVSELSLEALVGRRFSELSGGERQRVLIARALVQEPKIVLLDEPTAHLDLQFQKEIMDLLVALCENRKLTVIFAMHNVSLAFRYARRLILLEQGKILADGKPAEINPGAVLREVYGDGVSLLKSVEMEEVL